MGKVERVWFAWVPPNPKAEVKGYTVPVLLILDDESDGWGLYAFDEEGDLIGDDLHSSRSRAHKAARGYGLEASGWEMLELKTPTEFADVVRQMPVGGALGGSPFKARVGPSGLVRLPSRVRLRRGSR